MVIYIEINQLGGWYLSTIQYMQRSSHMCGAYFLSSRPPSMHSDPRIHGPLPRAPHQSPWLLQLNMASFRISFRPAVIGKAWRRQFGCQHRSFSVSSCRKTDGVFRDLTAARVIIPWIEALQRKRAGEAEGVKDTGPSTALTERDLSPKRMSDSYHSVILPLARDPWLSDTYLNVDGNIRCA